MPPLRGSGAFNIVVRYRGFHPRLQTTAAARLNQSARYLEQIHQHQSTQLSPETIHRSRQRPQCEAIGAADKIATPTKHYRSPNGTFLSRASGPSVKLLAQPTESQHKPNIIAAPTGLFSAAQRQHCLAVGVSPRYVFLVPVTRPPFIPRPKGPQPDSPGHRPGYQNKK